MDDIVHASSFFWNNNAQTYGIHGRGRFVAKQNVDIKNATASSTRELSSVRVAIAKLIAAAAVVHPAKVEIESCTIHDLGSFVLNGVILVPVQLNNAVADRNANESHQFFDLIERDQETVESNPEDIHNTASDGNISVPPNNDDDNNNEGNMKPHIENAPLWGCMLTSGTSLKLIVELAIIDEMILPIAISLIYHIYSSY